MEIEKVYHKAEELDVPFKDLMKVARMFDITVIEKDHKPSSLIHKKDFERLKKGIKVFSDYSALSDKLRRKEKALSGYRQASWKLRKLENKIAEYEIEVTALRAKKKSMLKLV